jgi:hypothetical protein
VVGDACGMEVSVRYAVRGWFAWIEGRMTRTMQEAKRGISNSGLDPTGILAAG